MTDGCAEAGLCIDGAIMRSQSRRFTNRTGCQAAEVAACVLQRWPLSLNPSILWCSCFPSPIRAAGGFPNSTQCCTKLSQQCACFRKTGLERRRASAACLGGCAGWFPSHFSSLNFTRQSRGPSCASWPTRRDIIMGLSLFGLAVPQAGI